MISLAMIALILIAPLFIRTACVAANISPRQFKGRHGRFRWLLFMAGFVLLALFLLLVPLYIYSYGATWPIWLVLAALFFVSIGDPRGLIGRPA